MTTAIGLKKTFLAACVLGATLAIPAAQARPPAPSIVDPKAAQAAVDAAYATYRGLQEGANADYIPALAKVDSNVYGIALITVDGRIYTAGDLDTVVSIQSISKVFTMAKVIEEQGPAAIRDNMGVDATGQVFNSIVAIEQYKGQQMNALVNPGAITATSMVSGGSYEAIWQNIASFYDDFAGRKLAVLDDVYQSEAATNQRNQAIGRLMYAYGRIKANPDQATDIYTRQCSVGVNARDLAMMAATLANAGVNPITGKQVMNAANVPEVLAVMATAGLYDDSGQWLYATGLPAKSGVGGGIIAVSPGKFGIAVISPPLDAAGRRSRTSRTRSAATRSRPRRCRWRCAGSRKTSRAPASCGRRVRRLSGDRLRACREFGLVNAAPRRGATATSRCHQSVARQTCRRRVMPPTSRACVFARQHRSWA
jgi:glutaminase